MCSPGNNVEQLLNGDGVYPRLWADLRSAKHTITVQMYYSMPGNVADTLAAILTERARAKVRVLFLIDAFGSQHLSREYVQLASRRRASKSRGCGRCTGSRSTTRAIDRTCASSWSTAAWRTPEGFGLADYWLGDGHHEDQWRESNVRFDGPAVMELQAAFSAAWAEATGELITGPLFFPEAGFQRGGHDARGTALYRADHGKHAGRALSRARRSAERGRRSTSRIRTSCPTTIFGVCSSARCGAASTCAC